MEKAIVIGASSGIGRALAKLLAEHGYAVGLAARRLPLLASLQEEIGSPTAIRQMDISDPNRATGQFHELVQEMGGVDLVVISAGTGFLNPNLSWGLEKADHRCQCVRLYSAGGCSSAAFYSIWQRPAGGDFITGRAARQ